MDKRVSFRLFLLLATTSAFGLLVATQLSQEPLSSVDAQVVVLPPAQPAPPPTVPPQQGPPPTPIPGGPGTYPGPGDTVPPGGIPAGACLNPGLTAGCGAGAVICCGAPIDPPPFGTPMSVGCSSSCACDPWGSQIEHLTQGYDLTFHDIVAFLIDPSSVPDGHGNVALCIQFENACEAAGFIYSGLIAGTPGNPIPKTVAVQVCVDGNPLNHPNTLPLNAGATSKWSDCLGCATVCVAVSFNKQCMIDAIHRWITFWTNNGMARQIPNLMNQRLIHVGVILCDDC